VEGGFTEVSLPEMPMGGAGPAGAPYSLRRAAGPTPAAEPPVTAQRAVDAEPVEPLPAEAPAPEAPGTATPTTASAATAAPAAGTAGQNLDELARRLYEPLSARLRAELWLDRERTGRSLTR
jgi:hypothetical protein